MARAHNQPNLIFFLTDNHNRDFLSAAGHPVVQTPNLDRIARDGVRFANAYCATTLCCPSRAAIATGRYPHQTGYWDNALFYDGRVPTWHHRLRDAGVRTTAIGKLHYRSGEDDNGFTQEIDTMHVVDGVGSPLTLLRATEKGVPSRGDHKKIYSGASPGASDYQIYDQRITDQAIDWLSANAETREPWALIVSYPSPHPPFRAAQDIFDMYPADDMPLPKTWNSLDRLSHPAMEYLAWMNQLTEGLQEDFARQAYTGYCALITHTDRQIGGVMDAAEALGLRARTRMIYTSDHGEAITAHGILGKANLYEHSTGVPILMSGPGIKEGEVVTDPVSQIDLFPTITEMFGVEAAPEDASLHGRSLLGAANSGTEQRPLFAEYHAMGSRNSSFMLRKGRFKLIYHVGMPNQLFDLETDPGEARDLLAGGAAHPEEDVQVAELCNLVDPEALDVQSKADQCERMEELGGEDAVRAMGSIAASPIPGKTVRLETVRS